MRYIITVFIAIFAISCNRSESNQMSRFHEDGRIKPSIAIASLLDTTSFDSTWSLSDELTQGVMNNIANTGKIFVRASEESPFTQNPFGNDLSWMKREFQGEEFVAFLELVEHEFVPVKSQDTPIEQMPNNLNMSVRVRVVDLRTDTPKIVLQEMIHDSYFVPKTLIPIDYAIDAWGTAGYRKTPMGIAHAQLANTLAKRIAEYVLLAKSR